MYDIHHKLILNQVQLEESVENDSLNLLDFVLPKVSDKFLCAYKIRFAHFQAGMTVRDVIFPLNVL